jgi:hypothetical protein
VIRLDRTLAGALLWRASMLSLTRTRFALALAASALLLASTLGACLDPGDVTVVPGIARYKESGEFVRVSSRAYDSDISGDIRIDVWVSKDSADEYERISPEEHGSGASLPYGTVIVREVLDKKTAQLQKLTLMVKGPEGVAPEIGDWWYAVTDGAGVPFLNDDGSEKKGAMPECRGCHEARGAEDDFLFGVPRDVRDAE